MSFVASSSATQIMTPSPLFYANPTSPVEETSLGWNHKWMTGDAPALFDDENNTLQEEEEDEGEEVRRFLEFMSNKPDNNALKQSVMSTPSCQQQSMVKEEQLIGGIGEHTERDLVMEEQDKKEDELFRRRMMARLSKSNGLEKMNPKKRRKRQLKYMHFIDTLIAEYNEQVEEDRKVQNQFDDNEYNNNEDEDEDEV
jgi:hypothetical protein